jgi:type VI secretion system protein VasG
VVIPYHPLSDEMVASIVRLQLERIRRRVQDTHGVPLRYDDAVVDLVVSRCSELESGARMIDALLTNTLLPNVSREFLRRMSEGIPLGPVTVSVADGDFRYTFEGAA